jgi:hypothetical protein
MRASLSFKYIQNYFHQVKVQKGFTFDKLHLVLLRCVQVFSELKDHGDTSSEVQYILDELAKISQSVAGKKSDTTEKLLQNFIEYLEERELDAFESIYPKIQILFAFIINNNRYPLEQDLITLEISLTEYIFFLNLMFEYYHNGEPLFGSNVTDFESTDLKIRGREISVVASELLQKYGVISETQPQSIWLPKIIVNGGYSFYDANRIAAYLENRGVRIIRSFFPYPDSNPDLNTSINKLEQLYQNQKTPSYRFFPLNWQKSFPDEKHAQDRFCPRCGLPFQKKMLLFKDGVPLNACDICVDL